ncbi:MAG: hypothetical protein ACE14L_08765 [Terriglobales bacterium]
MARVTALPKEQLTPKFAELAKQAESLNAPASVYQVLGHCPDMFQSWFQFYFHWHENGTVPPTIKELARLKIAQLNNCFT